MMHGAAGRVTTVVAKAALEAAPSVAKIMAAELGRDEKWQQRTMDDFERVARLHIFQV
jgi:glycerol-3-phosphate dehydrogenase